MFYFKKSFFENHVKVVNFPVLGPYLFPIFYTLIFVHLFFAEKHFLLIFYLFIHFFDWYKWVTVEVAVKTTNEGKLYLKNLLLAVG